MTNQHSKQGGQKPRLTRTIPFEVLIDGEEYVATSISQQNYASILRGTANKIDNTLRFTFTKKEDL